MSPRLVVVRPEPGNGRTAATARAAGFAVDPMPLFAVTPLAWAPPDPAAFDAVLLTSANAVRHGGGGIAALGLPVLAVGAATATAARAAGLDVVATGERDGAHLLALAHERGYRRPLHLSGRERTDLGIDAIAVYASEPLPPPPDAAARLRGAVALLHSARAARAVAALVSDRATTAIAAISPAVLAAAGSGWRAAVAATVPDDAALIAAAATLTG